MNTTITQKINELKNDRLHGANWLSIQAITILNSAIRESQSHTVSNFMDELKSIATAITQAKPSMSSIANYISRLLSEIITISQEHNHIDHIKNAAQARADELIKFAREAPLKAAEHAAKMLIQHDVVITCSYSSTICKTFTIAKEKSVKFSVIIAESRYDDTIYGEISAEQLKQHQIHTTVIPDEEIDLYAHKANKALVGADTICADGSLVNGIPSCKLAQAASIAKIQFYSVCETAKFDVKNYRHRQSFIEPGFDLTPSELITGMITETGLVKPDDIGNYLSEWRNIDENY